MTRADRKDVAECDPLDVAKWIGLADATLLGPEPIKLPTATVERLQQYGGRVELTTDEAGAILRVSRYRVRAYCCPDAGSTRPTLGYRRNVPGAPLKIVASDLAAWIIQTRTPPVPTSGVMSRADESRARKAEDECRRRHNLPPRKPDR